MKLIHYTSLINAFHILESKTVILRSLNYSNDNMEKIAIREECRTFFVFCCSKGDLNASLWLSYSGRRNGAAIVFEFENDSDAKKLLIHPKNKIGFKRIKYVKDYFDNWKEENFGITKDKKFKQESEWRYYVDVPSECDFDIKSTLNVNVLKKITLIVDSRDYQLAEKFLRILDYNVLLEENTFIN